MRTYHVVLIAEIEEVAMSVAGTSLSIVVPVYNSQATVGELQERIAATLQRIGVPAEVIYVDDGSHDDVWSVLQRLTRQYANVRAIRLGRNFGQGGAVLCGLAHARHDLVVTLDDDLQNAPEDIFTLYRRMSAAPELDVVFGVPKHKKQHGPIRNLGSRFLAYVDRVSAGSDYDEGTSSFRIMRRSVVDAVLRLRLPRPALAPMIFAVSRFIGSEPVEHHPRKVGRSGYTGMRLVKLAITRIIMSTSLPLRLLAYFGVAGLVGCFTAGAAVLAGHVVGVIKQPGWTTLVLLQFAGISLNFLGMGLLGEYLFRLLGTVQGLPQYVVRETLSGTAPLPDARKAG